MPEPGTVATGSYNSRSGFTELLSFHHIEFTIRSLSLPVLTPLKSCICLAKREVKSGLKLFSRIPQGRLSNLLTVVDQH